MAKRGDVLVGRRKLGFAAEGKAEHFCVVQSDRLGGATVLVVPLDLDGPVYDANPLVVHVSSKEAGAKHAHAVLVHLLASSSLERFEAAPASKLSVASMAKVDELLRLALDLP